jgi:hypothetical protein
MPTLFHDFEGGVNIGGRVRRNNRWRSSQQSARASYPLQTLMVKTQSMTMVRLRIDSYTSGNVGENWWSDAHR